MGGNAPWPGAERDDVALLMLAFVPLQRGLAADGPDLRQQHITLPDQACFHISWDSLRSDTEEGIKVEQEGVGSRPLFHCAGQHEVRAEVELSVHYCREVEVLRMWFIPEQMDEEVHEP